MSDTIFGDPVNKECTGLPALNPVQLEDILAGAIDGRDYPTIAAAVLAHPFSINLPEWIKRELGDVAFSDSDIDISVARRVLAAGNVFLKGGRA